MFAFYLLIEFFDWKSKTFLSSDSTVYQSSLKSAPIHCAFWKEMANNKAHLDIATCLPVL